jgi:hypothetical protein
MAMNRTADFQDTSQKCGSGVLQYRRRVRVCGSNVAALLCQLNLTTLSLLLLSKVQINQNASSAMATHFQPYKEQEGRSSGCAVQGVGLRQLACWDCGFESHREHGCLSVVSVVYCQVEVSATG